MEASRVSPIAWPASSMSLSARSDLPAPGGPRISTPIPPTATQVAWIVSVDGAMSSSPISIPGPILGILRRRPSLRDGRDTHDEARAENRTIGRASSHLAIAILGPDAATMSIDDLFRD